MSHVKLLIRLTIAGKFIRGNRDNWNVFLLLLVYLKAGEYSAL